MIRKLIESDLHDRQSLRGVVFEHIRDMILEGKYDAGDTLVESRLAKELGVSRTPVREAFRQLELEGLVTCVPNKYVIVEGVSQQDIEDIFTLRSMVEGLAARWAVERITPDEMKRLAETIELMDYYTNKNDLEQVAKLDSRFHNIIYEASKSKILRTTLTTLHHFIQRARLGSLKFHGRAKETLKEHKAIMKAFEDKDAEVAEELLTRHVSNAKTNFLELTNKI
ncbi:MAG: GntR family transcriptional regulator [Clostridia bacterium]|nr:GntR family transcriptional regulator [Clostridia bacterium]